MGIYYGPQTLRRLAGVAILAVLAGCVDAGSNNHAVSGASLVCKFHDAHQSHQEVTVSGTIVRILGTRVGRSGTHEGFLLKFESDCPLTVRIETNTDLTGPVPISAGEHVTLKGEYEYYPIGGVIHWTHHDPRGRHEGGYVEADGKIYQ